MLTHILSSFFFNDPATTEIYTLSLHDALPIYLNNYRNAHYRVLSTSKKLYSEQLVERIKDYPRFTEPVKLVFTYYARSNRRLDISNPCSIIDKFTCDALVKAEILEDDSFERSEERRVGKECRSRW